MIHISDITREKRLNDPREALTAGQTVRAVVLEVDRERRRIKLGIKQLEPTTADEYIAEHQVGESVTGRIVEASKGRAKIELGGTTIVSPATPAPSTSVFGTSSQAAPPANVAPTNVQWPGPSMRTAISVTNDATSQPSVLERTGPWSLFRILEAGSMTVRAETASATFIVAGRELRYQITTGSIKNPLNLGALRDFRCPRGI